MRTILKIFLILVLYTQCQAQTVSLVSRRTTTPTADTTNWYVSNTGSDSYNGHSTSYPLQTISALNSKLLQAGDSVFFKCGDSWSETLVIAQAGSDGSPIVVTSYGSGNPPIITGGEVLGGWVQNENIWACLPTGTINSLYSNGTRMTVARLPNTGYLGYVIDSLNLTNKFIAADELNGGTNTYVGARVRTKTNAYTFESRYILTSDTDTLRYNDAFTYDMTLEGWKFFIDGLYGLIDTTNEWAKNGDSLYFQPASGINPNDLNMVGIVNNTVGVKIYGNYVTVENLELAYHDSVGVKVIGNLTGIVIKNNTIRFQNRAGIYASGTTTSNQYLNNTIRDCASFAIRTTSSVSDSIAGNDINFVGMYRGYGRDSLGWQGNYINTAISVFTGDKARIFNNDIDSSGYIGIQCNGTGNLISYNYEKNTINLLAEGGAIYGWGSTHYSNTWRKNIIVNSGVNNEFKSYLTSATNFHPDGRSHGILIDSNTVINSRGTGLAPSLQADTIVARANTFYRCFSSPDAFSAKPAVYQYLDTTDTYCDAALLPLTLKSNIILSLSGNTSALYRQYVYKGNFRSIVSDSNKWVMPYSDMPYVARIDDYDDATVTYLTFPEWQAWDGQDANGDTCYFGKYPVSTTPLDTIFYNPTLSDSTIVLDKIQFDLNGDTTSLFTLKPFESKILLKQYMVRDTIIADNRDAYSSATYQGINTVSCGQGATTTTIRWGGLEFKCEVPQGATIDTCLFISTCAANNGWDPALDTVKIKMGNIDNAPVFSEADPSGCIDNHLAPLVADSIYWSGFTTPAQNVVLTSPNLASLLQVVIDRETYTENNYIGISLSAKTPTANHRFTIYDMTTGSTKTARIRIIYH